MDIDPQAVKVAIEFALSKFASMLETQFGVSVARRKATADRVTKVMHAETDIEVRKLAVQAEYAEKTERLLRERDLKKYEAQLRAEDAPYAEPEVTIDWPVPDLAIADSPRKPLEYVEQKRLRNFKQVSQLTANALLALPAHATISEEPVDPDWTARFFENVKDISNDDMQKLWAKLLAGEIASPGRFSLRTLDVLKNITSVEAKLFEQALRHCNNDGQLLVVTIDVPWRCKLSQNEMLRLVECGFFHSPLDLDQTESDKYSKALKRLRRFIPKHLDFTDGDDAPLVYSLTSVGAELATLSPHRGEDAKAGGDAF